ncbi:MAG: hypothetical protein ABI847_01425, partial [Anaerolineales bacterium]
GRGRGAAGAWGRAGSRQRGKLRGLTCSTWLARCSGRPWDLASGTSSSTPAQNQVLGYRARLRRDRLAGNARWDSSRSFFRAR